MAQFTWADALAGVRRVVARDLGLQPESLDMELGLRDLGASPTQVDAVWRHLDAEFGIAEILRSEVYEQSLELLAISVLNSTAFDNDLAAARQRFGESHVECEGCGSTYWVFAAIQSVAERIRRHPRLPLSWEKRLALSSYTHLYRANLGDQRGLSLRQLYSRLGSKKAETESVLATLRADGLLDDLFRPGELWLAYICPICQEERRAAVESEGGAGGPMDDSKSSEIGISGLAISVSATVSFEDEGFEVIPPGGCPTFADVGGLDDAKEDLRSTVGLLLKASAHAKALGIAFNGTLLHGPPGSGKSFVARACAGEFGCNFVSAGVGDLIHGIVGESPKAIARAFDVAQRQAPAILFFDEIDAIAVRRDTDAVQGYEGQVLAELFRGLERVRETPEVQVIAATNYIERLDPALTRSGRFDRKIRLSLPDSHARKAIVSALLSTRPTAGDIDSTVVAKATEGWSAASITSALNLALLGVLRELSDGHDDRVLTQEDLLRAIAASGARDRPMAEQWDWHDLILPGELLRELRQLQRLIQSTSRAHELGIEIPRGILLYGPPGTGKTTIAKVLAAQARTSFYPRKGSDLVTKWLGQASQNIADLFARARENAPSIIFIDEFDSIAGTRGQGPGSGADRERDATVNQLLQELDGLETARGVFLVGATNRADMLDPALLRGGRIGRHIEIPLPDQAARLEMLQRFTARMQLGPDVSERDLSYATDGYSGADLFGLCQQAAIAALVRSESEDVPEVAMGDFLQALSSGRERLAAADFQ